MLPERARGKAVDERSDIWAFGGVLHEMLTGRQLLAGDTAAAVLRMEPDWRALPAAVPSSLRRALARCLEKDPRQRLRDMGGVRIELAGAGGASAEAAETTTGPAPEAVLFEVSDVRSFDVAPAGRRLLLVRLGAALRPPARVRVRRNRA
jgi:hypothetical protein